MLNKRNCYLKTALQRGAVWLLLFGLSAAASAQLGDNLALNAGADGSSKASGSSYGNVTDGNATSYWQPSGTSGERIAVKGFQTPVNTAIIREPSASVADWRLVNHDTGQQLAAGSGLGAEAVIAFGTVSAGKINLYIDSATGPVRISEFELYNASGGVSSSSSSAPASSSASSSIWSSSSSPGSDTTEVYQPGDAAIYRGIIDSKHSGYTGEGFIDYENVEESYVEWTVNSPINGNAEVTFFYANGTTSSRPLAISVNGNTVSNSLDFPGTGAWNSWQSRSISVYLNAGANTLRAASTVSSGGPNLDRMEVTVSGGGVSSSSSSSASSSPSSSSSSSSSLPATGNEVTYTNGRWWARVDGSTVYEGSRMFDAVNAAIDQAGSGIINIRNSGESGPDGGNVYSIRPRPGQTLDFHGHQINANGGDLVVPIYCDRRNGITVRNLHVEGNPRYGIWFRGCSDVVLENITMDLSNNSPVGLGIRVDGSTGSARNLTITGNININGAAGHAIETYSVDGFTIGDVTVTNNGGSGLLLNDSRNGTVGNVVGHYNNQGGGYATFRVANNNGPNVHVQSVYSRHSGRGFFSVSGSHGTTVEHVDIADSSSHGIFLEDAFDTHVLSGRVANGNPNCQLVRTSDSSINVSGCDSVGTSPGGSSSSSSSSAGTNNGTVDGTYRIVPVHSGKALDVDYCSSADGTNVHQWDWLNNDCQKWIITPVDGHWHRISPVNAASKSLDVDSLSTDDGANIMLWEYWGGDNQQFRFQSSGSGRWRIINRLSEKCLDIAGNSPDDGANLNQWQCLSGAANQQFELERQ